MRQGCRQLYRSFWHSNFITCERVAAGPTKVAKKKQFLTGVAADTSKWQKSFSFWGSNYISCERAPAGPTKVAILPQFLTLEPRFDTSKSQFYCSFWHSNLVSCEKVAAGPRKVEKKKSILCHPNCERVATSFRLVGTACGFKRDKKKKERDSDRGQETEREREGEREGGERERRCEDKKMWRSEDKKIRRCDEDVNTWRCRRTLRWDALGKNHTEIGFICTILANNGAPPCNYKQYQPVIN